VTLLFASLAEIHKALQNNIHVGKGLYTMSFLGFKPTGYVLNSQRCGKDSAASFKTLMNVYDIKDDSIPKYKQILKKRHRIDPPGQDPVQPTVGDPASAGGLD